LHSQLLTLLQQQLTAHIDASLETTKATLLELTHQHTNIISSVAAVSSQVQANHTALQQDLEQLRNEALGQTKLTEVHDDSFYPQVYQLSAPTRGTPAEVPSPSSARPPLPASCVRLNLNDIPMFSAEDRHQRPDRWLFRAKRMMQVMRIPESEWVEFATLRLDGAALAWWQTLELSGEEPTDWNEFSEGLRDQFGSLNPEQDARDTFWYHLRQITTVREYVEEFRSLLLELPTVDDGTKKDRFIQGLKDSIRHEVVFRNPISLSEAMSLAERCERAGNRAAVYNRPRTYAQVASGSRPTSVVPPRRLPPRPDVAMSEPQRPARLTEEEREKLRATGSCFRCRQPGHTSYQCPVYGPRIRPGTPVRPIAMIGTPDMDEEESRASNN
jgi:hypothetical protein